LANKWFKVYECTALSGRLHRVVDFCSTDISIAWVMKV
jgi:hypothetical protein